MSRLQQLNGPLMSKLQERSDTLATQTTLNPKNQSEVAHEDEASSMGTLWLQELLPGDIVKHTTSASAWLGCNPCPCAGALHCTGREPTQLQSWTPGVVLFDARSDLPGVVQWSKYMCRDMWSVIGIACCECGCCQASSGT